MTNKDKAREYLLKEHISPLNNIFHQCDLNTELQYHKDIENAFIKGAEWKDEQAISEQGGWHTEIPDVDCFVLLRTVEFPKNCKAIVAEWDNENKCFYSEADDSPVEEWSEWKLIEIIL